MAKVINMSDGTNPVPVDACAIALRLGNQLKVAIEALAKKDEEHAAALAKKDEEYATALAEKDEEHATALAKKDEEYAAALVKKDEEHAKKDASTPTTADMEEFPDPHRVAALEEKNASLEHSLKQVNRDLQVQQDLYAKQQCKLQGAKALVTSLEEELKQKVPEEVRGKMTSPASSSAPPQKSAWKVQPVEHKFVVEDGTDSDTDSKSETTDNSEDSSIHVLRKQLPNGPSGKSTASDKSTKSVQDDEWFPTRECRYGSYCDYQGDGPWKKCKYAHPGEKLWVFNSKKTELCSYYMNPRCECHYTKNECYFAHGENDLQPVWVEVGICQPCK